MARIVIAEDAPHVRNVLAMWLSRHGHQVVSVADGPEALAVLVSQPVDILITDVRMPGMSGIELANRAFGANPSLRWIFVVTASCDPRAIRTQLPASRVSTFAKPFSPSQLLQEVDRVAGGTSPQKPSGSFRPAPAAPPCSREEIDDTV